MLLPVCISFVLASQAWASSYSTPPTVDLGYGTYTGTHLPLASQNEFLGIRFGAAPVGNLRFRAPRLPPPQGHQNATTFPPICYGTGIPASVPGQSEDCLFLSVYAPSDLGNEKVPVMVFIQGGAFSLNSNANYNASTLVAASGNKMVFVEFQYRVGLHGFLASQDIKNDGDLNAGMLDQRAVFLWVQKYIYKFGGDPSRVVIVGDSAGAGSASLHLISYGGKAHSSVEAKAPFAGAVGISPSIPAGHTVSGFKWQYDLILQRTNCTTGKLACLRGLDISVLQAANTGTPYPGRNTSSIAPFSPIIDGDFIQDDPYKLFNQGKFLKVPVIFGDDTDEATYFAPNATTAAEVADFLKDQSPKSMTDAQAAAILAQYPLASNPPSAQHNQYFSVAANSFGEALFICNGIKVDTVYRQAGINSWNYRYDVVTPENAALGVGSPHTSELPNLFGGIPGFGPYPPQLPNAPAIIEPLRAYYTNFIRFLNPNGPTTPSGGVGLPVPVQWPTFNASRPRLLFQLNGISLESVPQAQADRCAFWDTLADVW